MVEKWSKKDFAFRQHKSLLIFYDITIKMNMHTDPASQMINPFKVRGYQFTDRHVYVFNTWFGYRKFGQRCMMHNKNCKAHVCNGTIVALCMDEVTSTGTPVITANVIVQRKLKCVIGFIYSSLITNRQAREWIIGGLYMVDGKAKFTPDQMLEEEGVLRLLYIGCMDEGLLE